MFDSTPKKISDLPEDLDGFFGTIFAFGYLQLGTVSIISLTPG